MAVAQDDGFRLGKAEAQPDRVLQEQIALPGVEEEAARADLEMKTKAMFRQQAAGADAILDQRGDYDLLCHCVRQIWLKRLPGYKLLALMSPRAGTAADATAYQRNPCKLSTA